MWRVGRGDSLEQAIAVENRLYESKINSGDLTPMDHKRSEATEKAESKE